MSSCSDGKRKFRNVG